jgi:hypothetical protein
MIADMGLDERSKLICGGRPSYLDGVPKSIAMELMAEVHELAEELLLRRPVGVQSAGLDPYHRGDVANRHAMKAAIGEEQQGRLQYLATRPDRRGGKRQQLNLRGCLRCRVLHGHWGYLTGWC